MHSLYMYAHAVSGHCQTQMVNCTGSHSELFLMLPWQFKPLVLGQQVQL